MRSVKEITQHRKIRKVWKNLSNDQSIQLKMEIRSDFHKPLALVKITQAFGWEHAAISFIEETPSWDCMQEMKEILFEDDEAVMQIHPAKKDYVNNHETCLHMWRPIDGREIPLPPTILVGYRGPEHKEEDINMLMEMQESVGSPISRELAEGMYLVSTSEGKKAINELNKAFLGRSNPKIL